MEKTIQIFAFSLAAGALSLQQASAQLSQPGSPQPPVTFQLPQPGAPSSGNAVNKPTTTKVLRIYGGTGCFDDALAEKLRPMLAKAFPSSRPDPATAVPAQTASAPAKVASQGKLTLAVHL
jgi:hypothetical protein